MTTLTAFREPIETIKQHLFTAVLGDVMDVMGMRHQFLPPQICALDPKRKLVGRAMPVVEADVETDLDASGPQFGLMFEALDDLKTDEIYVCTGASAKYALWGELMTVRAKQLGAAGAVVDGYVRDTEGVLAQDFAVFGYGSYAQDQGPRGEVVDFRCPITFGNGARVSPGDLLVGDRDGVLVIPKSAENEIIQRAYEKVVGESRVRDSILNGMSASEAYKTFGIM